MVIAVTVPGTDAPIVPALASSFEAASGTVTAYKNWCTNPAAVGTSTWNPLTGATMSQDAVPHEVIFTCPGAAVNEGGQVSASPAGRVAAASSGPIAVRAPAGPTRRREAGTNRNRPTAATSLFTATGSWQRITVHGAGAGATALNHLLMVRTHGTPQAVIIRLRRPVIELAPLASAISYFDGSTSPDPDLTPAWEGPANGSASILAGAGVANTATPGSLAAGLRSAKWSKSGSYSLRQIPKYPARGSAYTDLATHLTPRGLVRGATYTALATFRQPTPQPFTAVTLARSLTFTGDTLTWAQAPNAAAASDLRLTFTVPATADWYLRLYNGGQLGDPDTWWDNLAVIEGAYDGPWIPPDTSAVLADDVIAIRLERNLHTTVLEPASSTAAQVLISQARPGPLKGTLEFLCASLEHAETLGTILTSNHPISVQGATDALASKTWRVVGRLQTRTERALPGRPSRWVVTAEVVESA